MKANGKRYTEEFKSMIVELYKSGKSISDICSEYGLTRGTVYLWTKDNKEISISEDEVITPKEFREMQREMARIKEENEILKKAMAIFAKK